MEATEEKPIEDVEGKPEPDVKPLPDCEVVNILENAGHSAMTFPNGLTLGVRLAAVPGTRGVHVEVIHILDLRKAMFGRSQLAMQAAILDSINRPLDSLLTDVGLGELLEDRTLLSPVGRVEFSVLNSPKNDSTSLVHETRTVYTVFADGTSPRDVSWLTESSRVIPVNELGLLMNSDTRSMSNDVRKSISPDKWDDLEGGIQRAWIAILPILMGLAGAFGVTGSVMSASGTFWIPLIAMIVSFPLGLFLLRGANSSIIAFKEASESERGHLANKGDMAKVEAAVEENQVRLNLVGSLNFIVTPMMDVAASAIQNGDIDACAMSLYSILDECVRLSPITTDEPPLSGDPGLEKFLTLFRNLGLEFIDGEEAGLGLAYVGLTDHSSNPVKENEMMEHLAVLNNVLYDVGALSPDVKNTIDDMMNNRARDVIVEDLNRELEEPEAATVEKLQPEPVSEDEQDGMHEDLLDEMSDAGVDEAPKEPEEEPEPVIKVMSEPVLEPEIPVLEAQTVSEPEPEVVQGSLDYGPEPLPITGEVVVKKERKKRKRKGATDPLSHLRSSSKKKERGKVGA